MRKKSDRYKCKKYIKRDEFMFVSNFHTIKRRRLEDQIKYIFKYINNHDNSSKSEKNKNKSICLNLKINYKKIKLSFKTIK